MLGTSRIRALIQSAALQGVVLGGMPLLIGDHSDWRVGLIAIATVSLKGSVIPRMLRRALREAQIKREVEPFIGFVPTMLLGAAGTLLSVAFASELPLAPQHRDLLIVPASFSTVVTGFLLLTTPLKAITQVIAPVLENGIFIFECFCSMQCFWSSPVRRFVAVFVVSIIMHHINREFASRHAPPASLKSETVVIS